MVKRRFVIKWDVKATSTLKSIHDYVAKVSLQGARTVIEDILKVAERLNDFPEKYPIESNLAAPYRFAVVRHYRSSTELQKRISVLWISLTRDNIRRS